MNAKYETLQERETFSLQTRDILTFSIERPRSSVLNAASSKRSDSRMFRRQFNKEAKKMLPRDFLNLAKYRDCETHVTANCVFSHHSSPSYLLTFRWMVFAVTTLFSFEILKTPHSNLRRRHFLPRVTIACKVAHKSLFSVHFQRRKQIRKVDFRNFCQFHVVIADAPAKPNCLRASIYKERNREGSNEARPGREIWVALVALRLLFRRTGV